MDWKKLLLTLRDCVPDGKVTTYGNLSDWAFGNTGAANAIVAMLNAAVNADNENKLWTNRVVNQQGGITQLNNAREQLTGEKVPFLPNGNVDLLQCPPVSIVDCLDMSPSSPPEGSDNYTPNKKSESPYVQTDDFVVSDEIISKWQKLQFPEVAQDESFTWTGFDSAWTGNNPGAIAWMTGGQAGLVFQGVKEATFDDCLEHVDNVTSSMHLLMIDQPTIVQNSTGRRPVEKAISHEMGRAGSAVQPANRAKDDMFGDRAPIWTFLGELKLKRFVETTTNLRGMKGRCYLETFPALSNLGMFGYNRCPKYNPERRKTFDLNQWQALCGAIHKFAEILNIGGCLISWATTMQSSISPTKAAQDKLDAILCMLVGYIWWRSGLDYSLIIGDRNGYMVVPCFREDLRETLRNDAVRYAVPVDRPFTNVRGITHCTPEQLFRRIFNPC